MERKPEKKEIVILLFAVTKGCSGWMTGRKSPVKALIRY